MLNPGFHFLKVDPQDTTNPDYRNAETKILKQNQAAQKWAAQDAGRQNERAATQNEVYKSAIVDHGITRRMMERGVDYEHLYQGYKEKPHQPSSVVLKYVVHRVNHLADYDDPAKGHALDRDFLRLVQKGDAGRQNGDMSIKQLHGLVNEQSSIIPQLMAMRDKTQAAIKAGMGFNVRDIKGEPHVALTRGLSSSVMTAEHPLSSWACLGNSGFGSHQHHAWIPLKDIWYSYHLGPENATSDIGIENELVASNSAPKYEATREDVADYRTPLGALGGRPVTTKSSDQDLINCGYPKTLHGPRVLNELSRLPLHVRQAWANEADRQDPPSLNSHIYVSGDKALENAVRDSEDPKYFENINLEPRHLMEMAKIPVYYGSPYGHELLGHPNATPEVANALVDNGIRERNYSLIRSPLVSVDKLQSLVDSMPNTAPAYQPQLAAAIAHNPNVTDDQLRSVWPHVDVFSAQDLAKKPRVIPVDAWRQWLKYPYNGAPSRTHKNNHEALASLLESGEIKPNQISEALRVATDVHPVLQMALAQRLNDPDVIESVERVVPNISKLDPSLAKAIVENYYKDPESFHYPFVNTLRHRSLSAEDIRDLWPKDVPFPAAGERFEDVAQNGLVPLEVNGDWVVDHADDEANFNTPTLDSQPGVLQAHGPHESRPELVAMANAYYLRKALEKFKKLHHQIQPFPADLAKSEWDREVESWISKQRPEGWYYATSPDHAQGILRDQAIEPQPTHHLLEGQAVQAHEADDQWLETYRAEHPDDVILHFTTDQEPSHKIGSDAFWLHRLPCDVRLVDAPEAPLEKFHTPLKFPKLGLPDDRRETRVLNSPRQSKIFVHAVTNMGRHESASVPPEKMSPATVERYQNQVKRGLKGSWGVAYAGNAPPGDPGYLKPSTGIRSIPGAGQGVSHMSAAVAQGAQKKWDKMQQEHLDTPASVALTQEHENLHNMFARVQAKYGMRARENLARNLMHALPADVSTTVHRFLATRNRKAAGDPEEAITELGTYLNGKDLRERFHRKVQHGPERAAEFYKQMKRAWSLLSYIAPMVHQGWLHDSPPWMRKSEDLNKVAAPLKFPGLGLPDDRRETYVVNDMLQYDNKVKALSNQIHRNLTTPGTPEHEGNSEAAKKWQGRRAEFQEETYKHPSIGVMGASGYSSSPTVSYAQGEGLRQRYRSLSSRAHPERDPARSMPEGMGTPYDEKRSKGVVATVEHENLHNMFGRVHQKYGSEGRRMLASNLLDALPKDLRDVVLKFGGRRSGLHFSHPLYNEESLVCLMNYLNNPRERALYHHYVAPGEQESMHAKAKMAYRALYAAASVATPEWTQVTQPWLKKSESDALEKMAYSDREWDRRDVEDWTNNPRGFLGKDYLGTENVSGLGYIHRYTSNIPNLHTYLVTDTPEPIHTHYRPVIARVSGYERGDRFDVDTTVVSPQYQKRGVAQRMYDHLLGQYKTVSSGTSQSPGARGVWERMAKNPKYSVKFAAGNNPIPHTMSLKGDGDLQKALIDHTKNPSFSDWFKDSHIKDGGGKPLVVYHGATKAFKVFDPQKSSPDNYVGSALYFTSSPHDASHNYASMEGPDLKSRIEREAENKANEEGVDVTPKHYAAAKKRLAGNRMNVTPVHLSLQNPVYYHGDKPTTFSIEQDFDDNGDPVGDEHGNGVDLFNAIHHVSDRYDLPGDEVWGKLQDLPFADGVTAHEIHKKLSESPVFFDMMDGGGANMGGQFLQDVWRELGYDGVVMDAHKAFPNMPEVEPGTTHYIAFEPHQVKSIFNQTFNPRAKDFGKSDSDSDYVFDDIVRE